MIKKYLIFLSIIIGMTLIYLRQNTDNLPQSSLFTHTIYSGAIHPSFSQMKSALQPKLISIPKPLNETNRKMEVLEEILVSKNDNDPRLDSEFKEISEELKTALKEKYENIKPEKRNERGTILFLLGRNLSTKGDFEFFQQVMNESPCLSLSNCQSSTPDLSPHGSEGQSVTLAYPQVIALKSIENFLANHPHSTIALHTVKIARQSKISLLREMAENLRF